MTAGKTRVRPVTVVAVQWLDRLPSGAVIVIALFVGLAPFVPEPHLWEKLNMLAGGTLARPIDVLDLVWHGSPLVLLALKLARVATIKRAPAIPRSTPPPS